MKPKKEYTNWVQVAMTLTVSVALYAVGEVWFSLLAVGVALLLTVDEYLQRKGGK